jgi:Arc/MetJ family transcription regulator
VACDGPAGRASLWLESSVCVRDLDCGIAAIRASGGLSVPSAVDRATPMRIYQDHAHIYWVWGEHLIDIDERALAMPRAELGTTTIEETVNAALRRATSHLAQHVAAALDSLAAAPSEARAAAWR